MTALAAARFDLSNKGPTPFSIGYEAEASQTFYNGAVVAKNASGYLVPAAATAGLKVVGWCDLGNKNSVVSSATQGETVINVRSGIIALKSGTSTDAVTIADLENEVYVLDDQTISRLPGSGRPVAGILKKVEGSLFHVAMGAGTGQAQRSTAVGGGTAYQGPGSTESISSAGALSVNTEISLVSVTGTTAYTLADGLFKGQRKIVTCTAGASTPVGTVTPATPSGFATVTAIGAVGDSVELIWTGAAWVLGPSFGCTFT